MTIETALLSGPQKRILDFVVSFIEESGFPPTLAEIARACGILNRSSVDYHLRTLQTKGFLRREECRHRGLEVVSHPFRLPVLGRVSAGSGVLAREDVEEHVMLDGKLARAASFLLRVRGESMTGAGVLDGDLVAVRRQDRAEDKDLVAALVGEEAVVKRLRRSGRSWELRSEHPGYAPIKGEFRIVGKVVGLVRRYS